MSENTDEFWYSSSNTCFNFGEENDDKNVSAAVDQFGARAKQRELSSSLEDNTILKLSLASVLSKHDLDAVLDDTPISIPIIPDIRKPIIKMHLGRTHILASYRTLEQKLQLLDGAVLTDDGNVIITVLLHIRRSLKLSQLYHHLSKRKVALEHYVNYLMKRLCLEELADLLMYKRNFVDIVYLYYLECKAFINKSRTLNKLNKFLSEYRHMLEHGTELLFVDFQKFTKWQVDNGCHCDSPVEQLVEICKKDWSSNQDNKVAEFKQFIKLSEFQYQWIVLNGLCSMQLWLKLTDTFLKLNWLSKNSFKSVINIELFILTAYIHNAPPITLYDFLMWIPNGEESMLLAKKMYCHKFVIDYYISHRDRQSIMIYKNSIPYQSEDYIYAENILEDTNKKWKT